MVDDVSTRTPVPVTSSIFGGFGGKHNSSPEAGAFSLQQTIVLHDDGDVILVMGSGSVSQRRVRVSKTAMILASPVWKAMFERHWKENESTEIPLPDDDIEAILLVLRIAHLRFHELPRTGGLTIAALLKLAVVCDKYDLVKLVRPFLDLYGWASSHLPDIGSGKNCNPSWFFIAWTFGYKDSFEYLATYVVRRIQLNAHGDVVMNVWQAFPHDAPPGLLESMIEIRKVTLTCMLNTLYETLDKLLKGPICKINASWEEQCRAMVLGSYVSFLVSKGLYPLRRTAANFSESITQLEHHVRAAAILTFESHDYVKVKGARFVNDYYIKTQAEIKAIYVKDGGVISHKCCSDALDFQSQIRRHMDGIRSLVLESHRRHMDTQALK